MLKPLFAESRLSKCPEIGLLALLAILLRSPLVDTSVEILRVGVVEGSGGNLHI